MAPNYQPVDVPPELPEKMRKSRSRASKMGIEVHEVPWKLIRPAPGTIWAHKYGKQKLLKNFTKQFNFKLLENDTEIIFRPVKLLEMVATMDCLQLHQFVNNVQDGNWESVSLKIVTKAAAALENLDDFRKL